MNARVEAIGATAVSEGVRVKLCGMSRPCDVEAVNAAMPDLCGFIVDVPRSKRNVCHEDLPALRALLDPAICAVGVFVDADPALVAQVACEASLGAVQLHGHEDAAYVKNLRGLLAQAGEGFANLPFIQAFSVRSAQDVERANASAADLVLLDNGAGGTGEAFDWSLLEGVERPFMLAGGLSPANVARAVREALPLGLWGVDMSSGIETDGLKDPAKIAQAVKEARSAW